MLVNSSSVIFCAHVNITYVSYKKGSPQAYSFTEGRVPQLIPVLDSQPAGNVSHKPDGRLPLLSARPTVTLAAFKRASSMQPILLFGEQRRTMGVNSLPNTVTRQRRDCDLNPGHCAPESSTLTTRLPSHHRETVTQCISVVAFTHTLTTLMIL